MAKELKKFPVEKIGPQLLAHLRAHGRVRDSLVDRFGIPDLKGVPLKGMGTEWKILSCHACGFTAYDTGTTDRNGYGHGRFRWQGNYTDAETDFDWGTTNPGSGTTGASGGFNLQAEDHWTTAKSLPRSDAGQGE